MVEGVIGAYLRGDPKGVLEEVEAAPWSHDPDQTAGPDGDFSPCAPAFDARRRSPVSVSERLHHLVTLDCAPSRRERGCWLKKILRKDSDRMPLVDFDLRDQLRTEFAGCLDAAPSRPYRRL